MRIYFILSSEILIIMLILLKLIGWRKRFYTSINSMSRNLGTIFLPPAPKMCNDVDKNKILMTNFDL